jgi:acetylornithine/succinyldiaminopimelate/putrescine aminotransferase
MSEEYLFKQSSTFAGGSLGCRIGLRTVELITADDGALMRNAAVVRTARTTHDTHTTHRNSWHDTRNPTPRWARI